MHTNYFGNRESNFALSLINVPFYPLLILWGGECLSGPIIAYFVNFQNYYQNHLNFIHLLLFSD